MKLIPTCFKINWYQFSLTLTILAHLVVLIYTINYYHSYLNDYCINLVANCAFMIFLNLYPNINIYIPYILDTYAYSCYQKKAIIIKSILV